MISASFESVCCCGCRRPYREGAALEKTRAGWVLASCVDPREAPRGLEHVSAPIGRALESIRSGEG